MPRIHYDVFCPRCRANLGHIHTTGGPPPEAIVTRMQDGCLCRVDLGLLRRVLAEEPWALAALAAVRLDRLRAHLTLTDKQEATLRERYLKPNESLRQQIARAVAYLEAEAVTA